MFYGLLVQKGALGFFSPVEYWMFIEWNNAFRIP